MKKSMTKKWMSILTAICMVVTLCVVTVSATEVTADEPVIIGSYVGRLSDCLDPNAPMPLSLAAADVLISSYATYDETDGVQVHVELYVPWYAFPKPEFTAMTGSVSIELDDGTSETTPFFETADGESTIETDVDTGVTAESGVTGEVIIDGYATALNALTGGGVFALTYEIEIP